MVRQWWPGFVLLSVIWGASLALIKVAVDAGVPPLWVALWRCVLGAVALWTILAVRREPVPREPRVWAHSAAVAVLLNAVPFVLFPLGETRISSVLAGLWNACTPLFTLLFTLGTGERPGPRRAAGLGLGFAGVLVVLGVWRGFGAGELAGSLACLGAACCYGAGFACTRRFLTGLPYGATSLATLQISCAAVELALVTPAAAGAPHWPGAGAALCLLVLGALGTGVAYILNLTLVRTAGTTVAATVTYVIPLWSTALGALLLAEPVHWNTVVGGLLVVGAVALTRAPAASRHPDGARPVGAGVGRSSELVAPPGDS
ncbi:DMT family transporter [Kitasatospora sp. NBC_01302]|uniref:DMT family transporter n=1 Tax=Kitasatospora sp. NBC_01302 TaxID=2903575 RepID=UPI002E1132E3|nr:DMT family transporter [Kitasatospora sp. NBC_01302]